MYRTSIRSSELSQAAYISAIAVSTCFAGLFLGFGALVSAGMQPSLYAILLFAFFAFCSILLIYLTRNAAVSFFGVACMMVSLGCMMGPLVAMHAEPIIMTAAVITAVSMVTMSILGLVYQRLFYGIGPFLVAGLTLLIVAQFTQIIFMLMGFTGAADMPVLAWIGIAVFLGFTAYDWAEALTQEFTADNAVKASAGLGLNLANLFGNFLELFGVKSSDDVIGNTGTGSLGEAVADGLSAVGDAIDGD